MQDKIMTDDDIKDMCSKTTILGMQKGVDEFREHRKSLTNDDGKDKHDAVEKALGILSQAKVKAYIYADIPDLVSPSTIPRMYQFNTLLSLMNFDEDGNLTLESMEQLSIYNSFMWFTLFETITQQSNVAVKLGLDKLDRSDPETVKIKMDHFIRFVWECLYIASKHAEKHKDDA